MHRHSSVSVSSHASYSTFVLAVAVLLLGFVSVFDSETVAVLLSSVGFLIVPVAVTFTVIDMTAPFRSERDNGIIVPTSQLTLLPEDVQLIGVEEHVSFLPTIEQATLLPDALTKSGAGREGIVHNCVESVYRSQISHADHVS